VAKGKGGGVGGASTSWFVSREEGKQTTVGINIVVEPTF